MINAKSELDECIWHYITAVMLEEVPSHAMDEEAVGKVLFKLRGLPQLLLEPMTVSQHTIHTNTYGEDLVPDYHWYQYLANSQELI